MERARISSYGFLAGGGEMGERMRALDWSQTPLGPVDVWPQSLRSAVSTCIGSRFPIVLYWGARRVVLYNDAYAEILGSKHPWALGRPCQEVWSEIWDVIAPMLDGVAATGEATWSQDQLLALERRGYPEECYFSFSFSPVRGEDGQVEGIFTAVIESTGRVVGERRLALLRDLAASNATARTEREACALAMAALAASPQDIAFALAYLGNDLQAATPGAEAALAAARPELVKELPIPAGKLVVGVSPMRPYDEQYAAFLGLVAGQLATAIANARAYEDERKRAEALAEIDRAKTAFFSNVSHEFRTPLTLMLGPLEDALAGELPAAARERLGTAQRNALRLLKLVNTLLDFSRIEAGRAEGAFQPTDLAALTAELASQFRSACERAGLRLTVACAPLGEAAYVDREMWEKIVFNLLSNAFKFTLEGAITVRLRREGRCAVLEVQDSGTGIPAAQRPQVFERFHRVEGARGRSMEGSGIGLSLVRELVRLHMGEVSLESEPGRGSTFRVSLPLGSAHLPRERVGAAPQRAHGLRGAAYVEEVLSWLPEEPDQTAPPRAAPEGKARARVLLADDNTDMRNYARRLLAADYEVVAVGDGESALKLARGMENESPFDLVLSDVMMPKLDGFGLIAALRADERTRTLPVIVLSARAGEEARVEGLAAGADDYLVKPFSAKELLARVASRLEIARIRREADAATRELIGELREGDRRKDEFLATLAHELRNPLAPLRNSLHLLRSAGGAAGSAPIHDMMERQVNHLVRLVDDLLETSRISRGAFDLRKERVEVREIVRNALETSQPLLQAAGHRLELDLPAAPLWVEGDPVRLAQILANLLNNAARYTDHGGRIWIGARAQGGTVRITVRDNGAGIAPEALPRLFEMFSREHRSSGRNQGGLGIGLALSRRLAEMHQGGVEAKSAGPGKGSEFTVTLPLAADQRPAPAAGVPGAAPLPAKRILVVDDNRDAADSLSLVLKFLGADVRVARDGPEALAAFEAYDPTVVLLDIGLPGMDGYEVARRIRSGFPARRAALVALTGWGQDKDRHLAREAGFDRHLIKPAEIGALQALLSSLETGPRS